MHRYWHDIIIAFEAIKANKVKSLLTALGIIFGVAAVISMLAIGNGAQQEIMNQIKMVGVNNIIISQKIQQNQSTEDDEETEDGTNNETNSSSQGITLGLNASDFIAIKSNIPGIQAISSEIKIPTAVIANGIKKNISLYGVHADYFNIFNLETKLGNTFNNSHGNKKKQVCVIGSDLKKNLFKNENPIGQTLKCGDVSLEVIGVLKSTLESENSASLKINNHNKNIYIPTKTMLMRFKNRSLITNDMIKFRKRYERKNPDLRYNQYDKIIVQVKETSKLTAIGEVIQKMILRRHNDVEDFEITIPELLLKQQQKAKNIFNIVLGAIAGISLLVGGIGIMNIMLASVMERIKEIGTRLAIGAKRKDVIIQFLAESTLISLSGGIIGIILGVVMSQLINKIADILTIISGTSVVVAFGISVAVGILFGYMPAKKAANRNPVESLRYE